MRSTMQKLIAYLSLLYLPLTACQAGGSGSLPSGKSSAGIHGGGESSAPINPAEDRAYKKALLKCYKTGGSRIVKIEGKLRCY